MRRLLFTALVVGMALGWAAIAGAGHSTWEWTSDPADPNLTGTPRHYTVMKGDVGAGPGGNVECSTPNSAKLDYEDIKVGVPIYVGTFETSPGVFEDGYVVVTRLSDKSLDWEIASGSLNVIDAFQVIVKGGPASEVYTYLDTRADKGLGLTAPWNDKSGKYYGISNVRFCFDDKA